MGKGKYFIAIVLRGAAFEEAESLKQELFVKFNLRGALRSPPHITLHRPFEWREDKERELISALQEFTFDTHFGLELTGFGHFGDRVIFIAVENTPPLNHLYLGLKRFAQTKLHLLNEWQDKRGFHPHVTIAFRDLKKKNFQQAWDHIQQNEFRHTVRVEGFSLLKHDKLWRELHYFPFNSE